MSDSQVAIEGMRDFRKAYNELATQKLTPTEETKLREFYQNDFIPELAKHVDGQPVIEQYMPTGPIERYLQYHYIAAIPDFHGSVFQGFPVVSECWKPFC